MNRQHAGLPFTALAVAFIAIGTSTRQIAFTFIGIAFLGVAIVFLMRGRRR